MANEGKAEYMEFFGDYKKFAKHVVKRDVDNMIYNSDSPKIKKDFVSEIMKDNELYDDCDILIGITQNKSKDKDFFGASSN